MDKNKSKKCPFYLGSVESVKNDICYLDSIESVKNVITEIENNKKEYDTVNGVIDTVAKLYGEKEKYFDTIGRTYLDDVFEEILIRIKNTILLNNEYEQVGADNIKETF